MFEWIVSNLSTIIICAVVFAIIILDIVYLIRTKKKGKNLCGSNCAGCAMRGECHNHAPEKIIDAEGVQTE